MKNRSHAFTLIELLVVIAIIAILAAILFPVFAQAKMSAKKSVDLSNQKQLGTAFAIYTSDSDDTYPLAGFWDGTYWWPEAYHDTPANWDTTVADNGAYVNNRRQVWSNTVQPYLKNIDMMESPVAKVTPVAGWQYTSVRSKPANVSYSFNGLLHAYSGTAVNAPSQLRLLTTSTGDHTLKGVARTSPYLNCGVGIVCQYQASNNGVCASGNGSTSEQHYSAPAGYKKKLFSGGMNAVMADTSARFFVSNAAPGTNSDYKRDIWTNYNAGGWASTEWREGASGSGCHSYLFRPDFDFSNFTTARPW